MMKRLLTLLLCLLLALSMLTGCSEAAPSDGSGPNVGPEDSDEPIDGAEYDANGDMIRMTWYDEEGNPEHVEEYEYDAAGNCTKTTLFEDGALVSTILYEYGPNNICTKSSLYDENNVHLNDEEYIYEDGVFSQTWSYGYLDGELFNCIIYDLDHNQLKEMQYEDGEVYWWIEYEYQDGRLHKGTENNGEYMIYVYDDEGNELGCDYYDAEGNCYEEYRYED